MNRKFMTSKVGRLMLVGCLIVLAMVAVVVYAMPRAKQPVQAEKPVKTIAASQPATTPASTPTTALTSTAESTQAQQTTTSSTQPQAQTQTQPVTHSGSSTPTPQTAPPYISASVYIIDSTAPEDDFCDFTAVLSASALYHAGQVPYASHVVKFTLTMQPEDSSDGYNQTFTHTFTLGETKEFTIHGAFAKLGNNDMYTVMASGTMSVVSGSASLGTVLDYNGMRPCR